MKPIFHTILASLVIGIAAVRTFAADTSPLLAIAGKTIFEDDFSRADMKPKWDVGMGSWDIKDGVVTVAWNPADHHGAYAYIDPRVDYKDVVAEFSFKFDGAKNVQLNMGDSRFKESHAGHILRVEIMPKEIELVDMKLGEMKMDHYRVLTDPKMTTAEKRAFRKTFKDTVANFKPGYDPAEWHSARVEVVADELLVLIDGKPAAYLKSGGIAHATKNMLGFTIVGKSVAIKNVRFREATAVPEWAGRRAEVVGSLKQ